MGASLLALSTYVVLAVLGTWPLAARLSTHLPGPTSGDTGVYAWNLWAFRHEIVEHHRPPLGTSEVLSLGPRVNLSLHNYTPLANMLAFPLLPRLGVVPTYNIILLTFLTLNGWSVFLLTRYVSGRGLEAWLAGVLFAWAPALMARSTAHMSLVAAFPLPLLALATLLGTRTASIRYAILTGVLLASAAMADPYYGIYGALLVGGLLAASATEWGCRAVDAGRAWRHGAEVAIGVVAVTVAYVALFGGQVVRFGTTRIVVRSLYTPVLLLTALVWIRFAMTWRPIVRMLPGGVKGPTWRFLAVSLVAGAFLLAPTLAALGERLGKGRLERPPIFWRSSPPGVDLAAFLMPNPNHPLFGTPFRSWLEGSRSDAFAEFTCAIPFTVWTIVAWALYRERKRIPLVWVWLAGAFAACAVGPFLAIGGVQTHIPGPWALLRYVPILELARSPSRFSVMAVLAVSVVFGTALAALRDRASRPRLVTCAVAFFLIFELLPAPRALAWVRIPAVYDIVKADADHSRRLLDLPTGLRDGTSSLGNFSAETQFLQTHHEKRLIGGYLSRISRQRKNETMNSSVVAALVTLSEGKALTQEQEALAWRDRGLFLRRARVGYVVINTDRASPALREFVTRLFELEPIAVGDGRELYRPRTLLLPGTRSRGWSEPATERPGAP